MQFFTSAAAVLAFAASAIAQTPGFNAIYTPGMNEEVSAGTTFEITWNAPAKYQDEAVAISIIGGPAQASLVPIATIAGGIPNSQQSYQWSVDAGLGAENIYGIVIALESDPNVFQYSPPFHIKQAEDKGEDNKPEETPEEKPEEKPEEQPEEEDAGNPTQIIVTASGTKTVTLTSCPPTSTAEETTSTSTTSTPAPVVPTPSSTHAANTTTLATFTKKVPTQVFTPIVPPPATTPVVHVPVPTTPVPTPIPTGAGAHVAAGPAALIGGLAVAFFAL